MSEGVLDGQRVGMDARYPIGRFVIPEGAIPLADRLEAIRTLAEFPEQLRNAVRGLDKRQMGTPYREGGWTVLQLIHHVADSHMNVFIRVRLALTENWPSAKVYEQDAWVKLHDSLAAPAEWSLLLVESLHARWAMMLQGLIEEQWQRGYLHPEDGRVTVELATLLYAWHARHHLAHITGLRGARGW
jgi:hypothetical protein